MFYRLAVLMSAAALSTALYTHNRGEEKHRVVVVGAGVAGISAAATLMEHNVNDVVVLEASDRIGGRVHTLQFEGVTLDEGAEFVHGEKDNAVHELVRAYDLLVSYEPLFTAEKQLFVNTLGEVFNSSEVQRLNKAAYAILDDSEMADFNGSVADFFYPRMGKFLSSEHVTQEVGEALCHYVEREEMVEVSADRLADSGGRGYREYKKAEGDQNLKWKRGGYRTLFDFLLKRFPNPGEELPVLSKTVFGKRVTLIRLMGARGVRVECEDGSSYLAHHVIVTTSLGVLKKHAHSMFQPALPANKIAAIKALGFGTVAKVFFKFADRWWPEDINGFISFFSHRELKYFKQNSKHGFWTADIRGLDPVMEEERMLCAWLSGQACRSMEALDDHQVVDGILELLNHTLGNRFNISRPLSIMRSRWWNNPLTLGTYSFRTVQSDRLNISNNDLAQPILGPHNKPVVLFAGEATHRHYYSTVHGALETGRREAHRILNYIKSEKLNLFAEQFYL